MYRGQLTPVSQPSDSRETSPISNPTRPGRLDGFFQPAKAKTSATSPVSPALPSPLRRPGGYGGFGESDVQNSSNQPGGSFVPDTPTTLGPADGNRRPTAPKNGFPQRKDSLEKWVPPPDEVEVNSRLPRQNGYGGFGAEEPGYGGIKRSGTYPEVSQAAPPPSRMPSEPGMRPEQSRRNDFGHSRKKSMGPDTSRRPPPRKSLIPDAAFKNTRPVDVDIEFGERNPYHTPSDSMSSGYSDFSVTSRNTAQTSPEREDFRKESDGQNEYQQRRSRSRAQDLRVDPPTASTHRFGPELLKSPYAPSPMSDEWSESVNTPYDAPYQESPQYREPQNSNSSGRYARSPQLRDDYDWKFAPREPVRPSKGDCRACGKAIIGKCLSSSDGKLTGKYHIECFVCTDCKSSFSSSDVHVLNDRPYCEHDYHYRNGSLCGSCQNGIEGQYVEDEELYKYHVGCFCCRDCGQPLSDGYFEVDGYVYCEKDASHHVHSSGYAAPETELEPEPQFQPDPERYQVGTPRGAYGARPTNGVVGLPSRPSVRGRTKPAQPGRTGGAADKRPKMNKRMTRMGNMRPTK